MLGFRPPPPSLTPPVQPRHATPRHATPRHVPRAAAVRCGWRARHATGHAPEHYGNTLLAAVSHLARPHEQVQWRWRGGEGVEGAERVWRGAPSASKLGHCRATAGPPQSVTPPHFTQSVCCQKRMQNVGQPHRCRAGYGLHLGDFATLLIRICLVGRLRCSPLNTGVILAIAGVSEVTGQSIALPIAPLGQGN